MAGLFDTLNIGARSLQAQRHGVDVAGHNLANVNTAGYARQRVALQAVSGVSAFTGYLGAGADVAGIQSLRNSILDQQVQAELSISGSLEAQERAMQMAMSALNESLQKGETAGSSMGGLNQGLGNLFGSFQALSTSPVSMESRTAVAMSAQALAQQFNSIDQRLSRLDQSLEQELTSSVGQVNGLLSEIHTLNQKIVQTETSNSGSAHDLRNSRQMKIESLARLLPISVGELPNGAVALAAGGQALLGSGQDPARLEVISGGNSDLVIRVAGQEEQLQIHSGSVHGLMEVRDKSLRALREDLDRLAGNLISEVNNIHAKGFALDGSSGAAFFTGSKASDIAVNSSLLRNPALIQGSASAADPGDNKILLELAQLVNRPVGGLNQQTLNAAYSNLLTTAAQHTHSLKRQLQDQRLVESMVTTQRQSVTAVSIDEEITSLVQFQKAFQASARFMTVADEMLDSIINLT